ncbi:MAG: hypothetical protein P8X96_12595 [Desulfobacteraceae bacterium]
MSYLTFESMINLNRRFDAVLIPHLLDESFLSNFHSALVPYMDLGGAYAWLLYARLTEAALLCAGHYADNCEFQAAGDLLVNPRCIRLYDKANPCNPITKNRHMALSEQYKIEEKSVESFRRRFGRTMVMDIEVPALLPMLTETLGRADLFHERYLDSVARRMEKIAATIAFLLAWPVDNVEQLEARLRSASDETKGFAEANLCRFDPGDFHALGEELEAMQRKRHSMSVFLKQPDAMEVNRYFRDPVNAPSIPINERTQVFI